MATTPTNNPIPSEDPRDLKFNAGKFDEVMTSDAHYYTDRFGIQRWTIAGFEYTAKEAIRAYGYVTLKSFQLGAPLPNNELTLPNQVLQDETNGEYYRWDGAFPKFVAAGSTPGSTGGEGPGAWVSVGDASLRADLASASGAGKIGYGDTTVEESLNKRVIAAIHNLYGYTPDRKTTVNVVSMFDGWSVDSTGDYLPYGGGDFIFDPDMEKSKHDGAFIISPTVPWDGSLAGRDNWLNKVGETLPSGKGAWVRCTPNRTINILWYGATRVHADDNTNPINKFINKMLTSNMNGYIPRGKYRSDERILVDLNISPTRNFGELYGDGAYESVLYSSSTDANAIHFYNTKGPTGPDCFQGKISRIGFAASPLSGAAIIFGLEDFSDNFGNWSFDQVHFSSDTRIGTVTDDRIVLKLSWLFDCTFNNVVVTGYPNYGKAVEMDKVQFTTWNGGSISNAKYGLYFGAVSANNHSIVFTALDMENIHYGISSRDTHLEKIRFISPFIDIRDPIANAEPSDNYVVNIEQGDRKAILIDDIRLGRLYSNLYTGNFFGPTHNHEKLIITGFYPDQPLPSVPASDVALSNATGQVQRVLVYPATGTTSIFINGEDTALKSGEFTIDIAETIAIRYTGTAPAWRWKAIR
ncbi:hypothetical protein MKK42_18170 [Escherichia coli]|uniref:tail fiber/spike domain-containing protein n=1 Tax=Escherichia coli TaxID=562 RepID=UPI001F561B89|nr:hypothetical protein [Escherichia coli]MCI2234022.1 hypothetical protein [Escherichia coli]